MFSNGYHLILNGNIYEKKTYRNDHGYGLIPSAIFKHLCRFKQKESQTAAGQDRL